jgi:pimeloyl-ACP methyl ester carboxylesterase
MVQANGLRFRTMVDGPVSGEAVLLLHGFPEGAESWSRPLTALAKAGALAIAPDMRGYGMSDAPDGVEAYRMEHLIEDIAGIIKAFGRDRIHIAGHDWGAMVAWCFAAAHPEMTKSLTALSVGHPAAMAEASRTSEDQRERSRYIGLFMMEGKAEQVLSEDDFRRLRAMFGLGPNPDAVPRGAIDHFARSIARPGRLSAALNYYRANLSPGTGWSTFARTANVGAPTVLVWGDQDPAVGRSQAEGTAAHVTGKFRLEVLEGAGHWLQFERPAEVARSLTGVLSK